jgi:uncharacterized protein
LIALLVEWAELPNPVLSAVACNLDTNILRATLPLFESEKVAAIEWSFDVFTPGMKLPEWFEGLLVEYSVAGRLIGHGVFFSLFSGHWQPKQQDWLLQLQGLSKKFRFDHITEHFGFMTGSDFHKGAPISIPFTAGTLAIGRDRLQRIQDACQCPVGLENLALAYSLEEVQQHGEFLGKLVEAVNGFIILDLHNLYCQLHNFGLAFEDLISRYPLDLVREIHISGGSWEAAVLDAGAMIRRDTHDDAVPMAVFDLLKKTMVRCPNLKYVVLEQLGTGLQSAESRQVFQEDFSQMVQIIQNYNSEKRPAIFNDFKPKKHFFTEKPLESTQLYEQQQALSHILETAPTLQAAQAQLAQSILARTEWKVEHWNPEMIETARAIAQKWK